MGGYGRASFLFVKGRGLSTSPLTHHKSGKRSENTHAPAHECEDVAVELQAVGADGAVGRIILDCHDGYAIWQLVSETHGTVHESPGFCVVSDEVSGDAERGDEDCRAPGSQEDGYGVHQIFGVKSTVTKVHPNATTQAKGCSKYVRPLKNKFKTLIIFNNWALQTFLKCIKIKSK